jgi:hypothetical protein
MLSALHESVRRQATRVFGSVEWLNAARAAKAPDIRVTTDGALMLEWLLADRSLGIFFEEHERDSGWCFSAVPSAGGRMTWGVLANMKPADLFTLLVG